MAPHAFKTALTYQDSRWTNSLLFQAAWGRDKGWYTGNAYTLDANFNYRFNSRWSAWLKLRNLLDESYEDVGSGPGRLSRLRPHGPGGSDVYVVKKGGEFFHTSPFFHFLPISFRFLKNRSMIRL